MTLRDAFASRASALILVVTPRRRILLVACSIRSSTSWVRRWASACSAACDCELTVMPAHDGRVELLHKWIKHSKLAPMPLPNTKGTPVPVRTMTRMCWPRTFCCALITVTLARIREPTRATAGSRTLFQSVIQRRGQFTDLQHLRNDHRRKR